MTDLDYGFHKNPIPSGWSYPLKRSVLDAALVEAGLTEIFTVSYIVFVGSMQGQRYSRLMDVVWNGLAGSNFASGLFSITVGAIPAAERHVTSQALESALPDICAWMQRALESPPTWRDTDRTLNIEVHDGVARLVDGSITRLGPLQP